MDREKCGVFATVANGNCTKVLTVFEVGRQYRWSEDYPIQKKRPTPWVSYQTILVTVAIAVAVAIP